MRLKAVSVKNVPPIKALAVDGLSDVVVFAGPNGVGKTRLVQGLLQCFRSPQGNPNIRLVVEATNASEREAWDALTLDTSVPGESQKLITTLTKSRRRTSWESTVIQFESDRSIQRIDPYSFSWDIRDPWGEIVGWDLPLGGFRARFQDTVQSIFRKIQSRRDEIAKKAEALMREGKTNMELAFPDPIEPFKRAFSELVSPKKLVDPDPREQQLYFEFEGQRLSLLNGLSSGEGEVVNVVFDFILRNPTDSIVMFDEPELHLHPELSYKLLQTLRIVGANNQFILCTHSPDIITASLENSVVFIAPPGDQVANQAIMVREDDETHHALSLLGQSIGIISLGKRIVLIEGTSASLDKQTYGAVLRNRYPQLVLVPSGGKGQIKSFAAIMEGVLQRTLWGVSFFMVCDRDAVPLSQPVGDLEAAGKGHLRVLGRYHLENYFLDERVLASVFAPMEPENSWLRSPQAILLRLKGLAGDMVSYATALAVAAELREGVGSVDLMPKGCHDKSQEQVLQLILQRATEEASRIRTTLEPASVETLVRTTFTEFEKSLTDGTSRWKTILPGKQLFQRFASIANIDPGRLKLLYLKQAEAIDPYPFQEIVDLFASFTG
jgi:hypothetical protein